METTPYMDSITAARALLAFTEDEEAALAGRTLIGLEGSQTFGPEQDTLVYIQENFPTFLRYLQYLKPQHRDLVCDYYLVGKTQTSLGSIYGSTQTVTSFHIRAALRAAVAAMLFGGYPSQELIERILRGANQPQDMEPTFAAQLISDFQDCRNFTIVADKHHLHRPIIRRMMSRTSEVLIDDKLQSEEQALGWWIHYLLEKSAFVGGGLTQKELRKMVDMNYFIPDICGQFVIQANDPDIQHVFCSRANN